MDNFTEQTKNLGCFGEMLTALSEMGKRPGSRGASGGMMGKSMQCLCFVFLAGGLFLVASSGRMVGDNVDVTLA